MNQFVAYGVALESNIAWTCDSCKQGQKPFIPRDSERKGQQKQAAAKKKK